MTYLLFAPAIPVTHQGQDVNDTSRMGVYVACATIFTINTYILLNTYRWDWIMLLVVSISILLIWAWTGIYTAFKSADQFYKAAPQVYGQLSFWLNTLLTVTVALLPRFFAKAVQKIFFPRDVDIIREQIRQGKFRYLDEDEYVSPSAGSSATSSEIAKSRRSKGHPNIADDERPIYPPSVAPTGTTHNPRSQNGSDGTDYTRHRESLDRPFRPSLDRPRPSFDRARASMDRIRPSFEASNDFTTAARLTRLESSHSRTTSRANDITSQLS
jgi:phospholipid-translocating ATPase